MKYKFLTKGLIATVAGACIAATPTLQASVTFGGTATNSASGQLLSATATFDIISGTNLQVTLSNLGAPVTQPSDVLECLFFNLDGAGTLAPVSAVLGTGSSVLNGPVPSGQTLGDQWEYLGGLSGTPNGANRGISGAGLGIFGSGNFGSNSQNCDGVPFGIANGIASNANGGVKDVTLEDNSMVFTLRGLPAGFSLSKINTVGFQYGTMLAPAEPLVIAHIMVVPEPTGLALLAVGLGAFIVLRRHDR
ncbi:MAG: hypothetical protein C5B50_15625 [Verrucomicrobia bacterium]|nr:MAG: hypothetical protein C5B50_15625 [Verrucomicrobiota bacterium]